MLGVWVVLSPVTSAPLMLEVTSPCTVTQVGVAVEVTVGVPVGVLVAVQGVWLAFIQGVEVAVGAAPGEGVEGLLFPQARGHAEKIAIKEGKRILNFQLFLQVTTFIFFRSVEPAS